MISTKVAGTAQARVRNRSKPPKALRTQMSERTPSSTTLIGRGPNPDRCLAPKDHSESPVGGFGVKTARLTTAKGIVSNDFTARWTSVGLEWSPNTYCVQVIGGPAKPFLAASAEVMNP